MDIKYPACLKDAQGKIVLLDNKPVVNPRSLALRVEGLTPGNESAPLASVFGESGDVFQHVLWRNVLAVLWSFEETRPSLRGLVSLFCMRGKNVRNLWKACAKTFDLPLPPVENQERRKYSSIIGTGLTYPLTINFPRESSKVPGAALTMERFKCVIRVYSVPEMVEQKRLSAVCAATGYEDLFKSYMIYQEELQAKPNESPFAPQTEEAKFWDVVMNQVTDGDIKIVFSPAAIASGSVSTKEVYIEDELAIPGTVWWTGVNALMTDAYNRICAQSAPADKRTRLENSAFYSDFKKKLVARNISVAIGPKYISFLNIVSSAIGKYLRRGTLMSQEESGILDAILAAATRSTLVTTKAKETRQSIVIEGTTVANMRDSIIKGVKGMTVTTMEATAINIDGEEDAGLPPTASGGKG